MNLDLMSVEGFFPKLFANKYSLLIGIVILLSVSGIFLYVKIKSHIVMKRTLNGDMYANVEARKRAERINRFFLVLYNVVRKIPGLKKYLRVVERSYGMLCPYDDASIMKLATETVAYALGFSTLGVFSVLIANAAMEGMVSMYSISCAVLAVYIISVAVLHYRISSKGEKITEKLIRFFEAVKHAFMEFRNVPQAVMRAAEEMGYEINLHARQVYEILNGAERKQRVREYAMSQETNNYMKLFMSQAYEASENGDVETNGSGTSLLSTNLEFLRVEMMRDISRDKRRAFKLQGYTLVACLPVFFMVPLRNWGLKISENMASFYASTGYFVMAFAIIMTIVVYNRINKNKEVNSKLSIRDYAYFDRNITKGPLKNFMKAMETKHGEFLENIRTMLSETGMNMTLGAFVLQMMLYAISAVIVGTIFFGVVHHNEKQLLTTKVENIDSVVQISSERQKTAIQEHILGMTVKFLDEDSLSLETIRKEFLSRMSVRNSAVIDAVCKEVYRRVEEHQMVFFKWYEFVICIVVGVIVSFAPYADLKYRYNLIMASRQDEVRQFQSIIIMERGFDDVTIPHILEEMEIFSLVFRSSIRKCINNYSAGPREALLALKEEEKNCADFVELVDGFLAVENVGVKNAFAEVHNNREMSESMRMLKDEMLLEKKMDSTEVLAMLPSIIVVGGYLLLPLIIDLAKSLDEVWVILDVLKK